MKSLIKSWSKGGSDEDYFQDQGYNIKVVSSGSEFKSKMYDGKGSVWVELEFS
jgi:hypothetical protein